MSSKLKVNNIIPSTGTQIGISTTGGGINLLTGTVVTGVVTATSFSGSGANLTNLPAANLTGALPAISGASLTNLPTQVTIANNADNRIITGGSGVNLNGEANLIFNGAELYPDSTNRDKVGHRLNYRRNPSNSRTNTGSASQRYYKFGEIVLNGSESAEINMYGTVGYSAGTESAGKTTIIIRATNASTLVGFWYEETLGNINLSDVRWKYTGSNNVYELWVQANNYSNIAPFVRCTGNGYTSFNTDTGSNTAPSGSTALSTYNRKIVGTTPTIRYNSTDTTFHQNIKMDNGKGIDFSANTDAGGTSSATLLEDYEEGTYTITPVSSNLTMDNSRTGYYVKVGNLVTVTGILSLNTNDGSPSVSGSDGITLSLPYARAGSTGGYVGSCMQQNINSGAPTSSVGHPLWYNQLPVDYTTYAASNGLRFYINYIEAAYVRMTNSNLHSGYPGYTWISWQITYRTN